MATTRGDDGTTGLLFGGDRIPKDDPRTEAYGTIDEAVAALGLARANLGAKRRIGTLSPALGGLGDLILRIQRELFVVGAELATNPEAWDRLEDGRTRVSAAMVAEIEAILVEAEAAIVLPTEFVVPGETSRAQPWSWPGRSSAAPSGGRSASSGPATSPVSTWFPTSTGWPTCCGSWPEPRKQAESRRATPARRTPRAGSGRPGASSR